MKSVPPKAIACAVLLGVTLEAAQTKVACIGDSITQGSFLNNPI